MKLQSFADDYQRVEKAILFLEKHFRKQPELQTIARAAGLSKYQFQRLCKRWAGMSPKRFLQFLTIEHAKQVMTGSSSLLDGTYKTGLSCAGRLHNLLVRIDAATPREFNKYGRYLLILYGFLPSPFGECFAAITNRGLCHLTFVGSTDRGKILADFKKQWRRADIQEHSVAVGTYIEGVFGAAQPISSLTLHIKGTNFQINVWQALLKIPHGHIVSYEEIAKWIGRPKAVRAVANAIAHNPVAFLIPCHRVLRKTGTMGGYRWGVARKKAILVWEAGRYGNPGLHDCDKKTKKAAHLPACGF